MKKIFLFIFLTVCMGNLNAMQLSQSSNNLQKNKGGVEISDPMVDDLFDTKKTRYQIQAKINNQMIGFIIYGTKKDGSMKIRQIYVQPFYRNQKKYRVGSCLFSACITELKNKDCKSVAWDIVPTPSDNLGHAALLEIYKKMLTRLGYQREIDYTITPQMNEAKTAFSHNHITLNLKAKKQ